VLERADYCVLEAGSAQQAIAVLETHPEVRVVFTDIQMPGTMNGVELARYVKERWPPTIIVVCSGKVTPGSGELPEDVSFLSKPYDPRRLDEVLKDVAARLAA